MMIDETFFEEIGLGDLDPAKKQEFVNQLTELAQNRIALVLAEAIEVEDLERFNDIADNEGDEAAMAYIMRVYPAYENVVAEEVTAVKQSFIEDMNMLIDMEQGQTPEE